MILDGLHQLGFLIAAPQSGSGKTTVSLAIMAALRRRGITVAPFKCGPDFIDPGFHRQVTDRPSINLDGWICPEEFVLRTFQQGITGGTIAVIEGAMGLYDGIGASSGQGSSAQIAAITGAPVVLVVNAGGMAASAAALVKGFAGYDPKVRLAGVIFNNTGSESHSRLLRNAIAASLPDIRVFGCIPRDETLQLPSRHLGLVTVEDNPLSPKYIEKLTDLAEQHLDLNRLAGLEIIPPAPLLCDGSANASGSVKSVRIAVAQDSAFCFVYEDNLRLLREAGAETVPFSPIADETLPPDCSGIYLPGGYPELYAGKLAANSSMKTSIQKAVEDDMPVYAECGGLVYLTLGMEEMKAEFVGIFPLRARMLAKRKALGYRQVDLLADCVIGKAGSSIRGHEFHYSEIGEMPDFIRRCYRVSRQDDELGLEGYSYRNCLASYVHLHFGSNQEAAPAFVAACSGFMDSFAGK
jgi:cobyrinic acid a,c-diamide synthase